MIGVRCWQVYSLAPTSTSNAEALLPPASIERRFEIRELRLFVVDRWWLVRSREELSEVRLELVGRCDLLLGEDPVIEGLAEL